MDFSLLRMGRKPCCDKIGLKRGTWTEEEDQKLVNFILNNGIQCWRLVPKLAELKRCGKSCRLRWINYLRPDLKRGSFSEEEEDQIIQLHSRLGNRWAKIAAHFPGRTDNEIKNYWNGKIKKKLRLLGLDSQTHKKPIEHDQELGSTDLNSIIFSSKEEVEFTPNGTNLGTWQRENNENDMCGSSGNDNVIGRLSDNLDEASSSSSSTTTSMIFQSDSSIIGNAFSEGRVEDCHWFSENDFQHYGIDTTENLLSWDGFNSFDDVSSVGDIYN